MDNGNKNSVVKFGTAGWTVIIYCLLMFWFYVGMINDGSNFTVPAMAAKLGVDKGVVLNINSIAGVIGVLFFIVIGQFNQKFGARITSGVCTIAAGIFYAVLGNASSLLVYGIAMTLVVGSMMSAGYIAGGSLVAQWFPKKKGVVMGYTTMGHNLASAFYVPLIALLVGRFGIETGVLPISVAAILLGVFGLIVIRNTPAERGQNPDNVSDEVYHNEYDDSSVEDDDGGWTTAKLLKTKELWLAAITTGFFQICTVGVMTQLVSRNIELGFTEAKAVGTMTVLALVGVGGSWLIGIIDDRMGTKKTMIGFGIWYFVALVLNATEIMPLVYVSLFMIAIAIGGSANFTTSLPASIFGRHGFSKVNAVIFPIQGAITALCFAVNGFVLILSGSLRMAYIVFAVIALINVVIVTFITDKKYNRDFQVENKHK